METKSLHSYWKEVQLFFSPENEASDRVLTWITDQYSAPNRYYHNLFHIEQVLREIDTHPLQKSERITLLLVCFFHDVVYNVKSADNEVSSAEKLKKIFDSLEISHPAVEIAANIILETEKHESEDPLAQLFLDIDLSILGSPEDSYHQYVKQIEQEWQHIPYTLFKEGRKRFIQSMLKRENLFLTDYYRENYEGQARINLKKELTQL